MKKLINILGVAVTAASIFAGCHKVEDLPYYENGTTVALTSSKTVVTPTPADSLTPVVSFSWTSPKYATDSSTYKYVLEIDSTSRNFSNPASKIVIGDLGTTLTGKELNAILLNYGFTLGTPYDVDVRVISSYGNNNERYFSNVLKLSVTPYNDPSVLTTNQTNVVCTQATQTQTSNRFDWTTSFNGYTGNVNYIIQYDSANKNFSNPKQIVIGNNLYTKEMLIKDLNETGLNCGIPGGSVGKVEYRLKATTAQGAISYSNTVSITISTYAVKLYLVGGSSPADWNPSAAIAMIPDPRFPGTFFVYAKLTVAGSGIKFLSENTDWSSPTQTIYGDANGSGTSGTLTTAGGGNNINVPSDGIYRITVDLATSKYYLQTGGIGAVGLVGAFQGWNPSTAIKMSNFAPNRFIYITNMTQNDEFKFHDGNAWDNSANNISRWYDVNSSDVMIINGTGSGNNFKWTGSTGAVRAIFDYANINDPKYVLAAATEMRLVGDGIQGVNAWDPASSPQMTYMGNGVWTITATLIANKDIKFLAGNAWGAFDYEDNSGGSQATGTPRKIKWEGGNNFKTPTTTGSYTITLDEYAQTVTIN
ncbi:MAG TPA: SusE domain-containing protein [Chitinophagaceae bacterium]|nr:SusE domain-containing protein [Chitinophagaceae bacterium]